ncbi:MAG: TlpA family protein disulfide reductase [Anaerovoracaceae bacterium]|jgi:thiol-disulfide isomerase/thioredoxin
MNRNRKHGIGKAAILLLALVLVFTAALAGCGSQDDSARTDSDASGGTSATGESSAEELGSLKHFSAKTLDGGTFTEKDLAEKDVTVINVWQISCSSCISEMPYVAEFASSLPDNVQVVTLCLDGSAEKDTARSMLKDAGFDGITLLDETGDLSTVVGNIQYTPTTVVADSKGNLTDAIVGSRGSRDAVSEAYLEAVNNTLKAEGKKEIELE